jgi:hypothetical protein
MDPDSTGSGSREAETAHKEKEEYHVLKSPLWRAVGISRNFNKE